MTRPLTRPLMVCIERTCPVCGGLNKILTPEVRPFWKIGCSRCGTVLVDPRHPRPLRCEVVSRAPARMHRPA